MDVAETSGLVILFDGDTGADHVAERLERLMKVFVGPFVTKTLDEDISFGLDTPQKVLVVGESTASLAVEFRELDFIEQLAGVEDVRETCKGVVEVLHLRPILVIVIPRIEWFAYLLRTRSHSPATDLMYS